MSNPDFSATSPGYKKTGAGGYKYRKGAKGSESGPAHKDNPKAWPKPGKGDGIGFNKTVKFPHVKTRIVSQGVD